MKAPPPESQISSATSETAPPSSNWKKRWNRFGGDGFLLSLGVHALLAVVAVSWVVTTWVVVSPPEKESAPENFWLRGGDGGATRSTTRHQSSLPAGLVRNISKLVVSGGSPAVSLPEMPPVNLAWHTGALSPGGGNLLSGGSSRPGGIAGSWPGTIGGVLGRPVFAWGVGDNAGLIGTFYDLKQTPERNATPLAGPEARREFVNVARAYLRSRFDESVLAGYYRSPDKLVAQQLFIPQMPAEDAPRAFNLRDVQPSRWLIHYRGAVQAPKSGRFRFVGLGDDILAVHWQGRPVLDCGYDFITEKLDASGHGDEEPRNGTGKRISAQLTAQWGRPGSGLRHGPWIEVTRGQRYSVDVVLGETPGGVFEGYLLMEEAESSTSRNGTGRLLLFRLGRAELPEEVAGGYAQINCDMSGGDWVWKPLPSRTALR